MKYYISPKIQFKILQTRENIADTCWGFQTKEHGQGKPQPPFYYDIDGEGFLYFQLGYTGSCDTPTPTGVLYYTDSNSQGVSASNDQINALKIALGESGGNDGQNYGGFTTDYPDNPGGMS